MSKLILLFITSVQLCSAMVIYGLDDRKELNTDMPGYIQDAASASAIMVSNSMIFRSDIDKLSIANVTLGQSANLCAEERYAKQPSPGICSGFLVKKNILVTAAHCLTLKMNSAQKFLSTLMPKNMRKKFLIKNSQFVCQNFSWAFNFNNLKKDPLEFDLNDIARCEKVLDIYSSKRGHDYVVIKLTHSPANALPVKLPKKTVLNEDSKLIMIGHPSGLPLKVTDNGSVLRIKKHAFFTDLDAFSGNSGSLVIDDIGNTVGILSSGETDFYKDEKRGCFKTRTCKSIHRDKCSGEQVARVEPMIEFINSLNL